MNKKIIIASASLGLLLIIYLGFTIYFSSHYFWNTIIGSVECGGKTSSYVIEQNEALADGYSLNITDREGNIFTIIGSEISYKYIPSGEEESILKEQNAFAWPTCLFKSHTYELDSSVEYDADEFSEIFDSLMLFSSDYIEEPVDARIEITESEYSVIDETYGNMPVKEEIYSETTEALNNQIESITLSDKCYVEPKIKANDDKIKSALKQIDTYTASTVHYLIENTDETLSSDKILQMITVDDDFSVSINENKVSEYVQYLASKYNTYGDVRAFKTSSGDIVNIGGGDYGWVISKSKEKAQLLEDIKKGSPTEREPVYEQTAVCSGPNDIGNTYVEIDYGKQHLWFYKNGSLVVETDIVSGNINQQNGSVDGIYKIVYKEKDATLVGENYSSAVKYFMPFAYNIGIHDASWRDKFGGDIYKASGSHGCINVPEPVALTIFQNIDVGTPVVAYYREPVALTNNAAAQSNAFSYVKPTQ